MNDRGLAGRGSRRSGPAERGAPASSLGAFVTDWSEAPIGLPVVLLKRQCPPIAAWIDSKMEDGSAVWIRDETWTRHVIHRSDGYAIRRVVSRPATGTVTRAKVNLHYL